MKGHLQVDLTGGSFDPPVNVRLTCAVFGIESDCMTMSRDWDAVVLAVQPGGQSLAGVQDDLRPVIPPSTEEGGLLRAVFKCVSFASSLALHVGAAAAMLVWFEPKPGAISVPTDAITVEIIASDVIEAMELAPLTATSATASAPDVQAGSTHEAPAKQQSDKITPAAAEPANEAAEEADPKPPQETEPVRAAVPHEAEPLDEVPKAPEQAAAREQITAKLDEALEKVVPSGEEAPANPPDLPEQLQPKESREDDSPAAVKPPHKPPPQKDAKEKTAQSKQAASTPSRKGGDPSRGTRTSKANPSRASASSGAAINYAAIVRARVASRRPTGQGHSGTALVVFGISPSGGLIFANIASSSGDPNLDRSALAAVRSAAPFPPPPTGVRKWTFSFPFHFR